MYLRSYEEAAKGRHENTRDSRLIEADFAAGGGSDVGANARSEAKTRKCPVDCWDLEEPRPHRPTRSSGRVSKQACLRRGMSKGERAVTTPRIGWRKLTDPGD